jgi:hypothetical protein
MTGCVLPMPNDYHHTASEQLLWQVTNLLLI